MSTSPKDTPEYHLKVHVYQPVLVAEILPGPPDDSADTASLKEQSGAYIQQRLNHLIVYHNGEIIKDLFTEIERGLKRDFIKGTALGIVSLSIILMIPDVRQWAENNRQTWPLIFLGVMLWLRACTELPFLVSSRRYSKQALGERIEQAIEHHTQRIEWVEYQHNQNRIQGTWTLRPDA